jgi:hypothetical protein
MSVKATNGTLSIATTGLSSVDIYSDGHPHGGSIATIDNNPLTLPLPPFGETLEVRGFKGGVLKQRRVLRA